MPTLQKFENLWERQLAWTIQFAWISQCSSGSRFPPMTTSLFVHIAPEIDLNPHFYYLLIDLLFFINLFEQSNFLNLMIFSLEEPHVSKFSSQLTNRNHFCFFVAFQWFYSVLDQKFNFSILKELNKYYKLITTLKSFDLEHLLTHFLLK